MPGLPGLSSVAAGPLSLGPGLVALKNWMLAALPLGLVFRAELDRVSEVVVQDAPILERNGEVSTALWGSGSGLWSVLIGVVKGDLGEQVPLDLFPHVLPLGPSRVLLPHQSPSASLYAPDKADKMSFSN